MIFSTLSLTFMSAGAARCFFPRGVGQLLMMTSSMILKIHLKNHQKS